MNIISTLVENVNFKISCGRRKCYVGLQKYWFGWIYGFTVFSGVYNSRILRIDFLDVYWNLIAGDFSFLKVLLSYQKDISICVYGLLVRHCLYTLVCIPKVQLMYFVFFKALKIQLLSWASLSNLIFLLLNFMMKKNVEINYMTKTSVFAFAFPD